jgi:hypothetical protein
MTAKSNRAMRRAFNKAEQLLGAYDQTTRNIETPNILGG